jgi:hypothetical protein
MCRFSPSILVDVGVLGTPPVQHFFRRKRWLIASPFLASNRGQRLYYCFCSNCSPALGQRGYRRGRCSCSLLLPCLLYPNLQNGFSVPSVALIVNQSEADPSGRHRVLANDDGSSGLRWNLLRQPTRWRGS